MVKELINVNGMSCGHCVSTIEKSLLAIGVKAIVDLKQKTVFVEFDENKVNLEQIKNEIVKNGYQV